MPFTTFCYHIRTRFDWGLYVCVCARVCFLFFSDILTLATVASQLSISLSHSHIAEINGFTAAHTTITKCGKQIKISERNANICGRIGATQVSNISINTAIQGVTQKKMNERTMRRLSFTLAVNPKHIFQSFKSSIAWLYFLMLFQ